MMNEDFEDQLRLAIRHDEVEISADIDAAVREGRRAIRGRRVGWGVAACTLVAAASLLVPGVIQRVPAVPAEPGGTVSASPASGKALVGTEWSAVSLEGAALRPGTSITLQFGDGWVDGFGGCNTFGYTKSDGRIEAGAYRQDGDRLTIAPVATTAKGCANGVGDQEGRFLQALPRVERSSITSGGLVLQLFGSDGRLLLQFEPARPNLEDTAWVVTAIKGLPPLTTQRQPSLTFLKDSLSGYDGCHTVNGSFSAGGNLTIRLLGGRSKLCADAAVRTQAKNFAEALEQASRVLVQGDQLTLLGRAGTPLLQATAFPTHGLTSDVWQLDNRTGYWAAGENWDITLEVNHATLSGNSGCADYTAAYQRSGDAWTIAEPITRSPMPCPNTRSAMSERFLQLLPKVTSMQVVGNQLRLVTPDETLSFTRR
ncbi:MAG: META domain-containing protein [Propionicimonas sp.]